MSHTFESYGIRFHYDSDLTGDLVIVDTERTEQFGVEVCHSVTDAMLDAALVQEMIGRHAAPVPYFANAGMAVVGLNAAGTKDQKELLLPKIATGEARIGIAEQDGGPGADAQIPH